MRIRVRLVDRNPRARLALIQSSLRANVRSKVAHGKRAACRTIGPNSPARTACAIERRSRTSVCCLRSGALLIPVTIRNQAQSLRTHQTEVDYGARRKRVVPFIGWVQNFIDPASGWCGSREQRAQTSRRLVDTHGRLENLVMVPDIEGGPAIIGILGVESGAYGIGCVAADFPSIGIPEREVNDAVS